MKAVMSSIDAIIQIYARDVDVTLLDEALRRTAEERLLALQESDALQEAMLCHEELRAYPSGLLTRIDESLRRSLTGRAIHLGGGSAAAAPRFRASDAACRPRLLQNGS